MKSLSSEWLAGLAAGRIVPRLFAVFNLASGNYGFWNDIGDVSLDDVTYHGSGALGTVTSIGGVSDMSVPGLTATLSGLESDVLQTFFDEVWHQRPGTVAIGLLDPDTRNLIDAPDVAFSGFMDDAKLNEAAGGQATLTLIMEDSSRLATRAFPNVRSDGDQRARSSTDTFFQYVAVASQQTVYFDQPTPAGASRPR